MTTTRPPLRSLDSQGAGECLRLHAGRPDHRRRVDAFAAHEHERVLLDRRDRLAEPDVHAALAERLQGVVL